MRPLAGERPVEERVHALVDLLTWRNSRGGYQPQCRSPSRRLPNICRRPQPRPCRRSRSRCRSRGLRGRSWPRIDLGELGSRGAVEPAGRIDDASPYRGGDAGATDEEPTAFVDPYAGGGVGNCGDVGSPTQASDDVPDRVLITGTRLVGAEPAPVPAALPQFHTASPWKSPRLPRHVRRLRTKLVPPTETTLGRRSDTAVRHRL